MTEKKSCLKIYIYAIVGLIVAVLLDQVTKLAAVRALKPSTAGIEVVPSVFRLLYLENRGAAFGVMQDHQMFFVIVGVIMLIVIGILYAMMPKTKKYIPLRICAVLICGGAIGNMIDRIRLNYVIDFFYFELIDFPIFNVADIYVTVSCILFVLLILFYYKEDDFEWVTFPKRKVKGDL